MANLAATVIQALPGLTWRGLVAPPYDTAGYRFAHQQAERRWPYIDGAGHAWTGRDPLSLAVRLYFLNTVLDNAYPDLWERWRIELFDGEAGTLNHPLIGRIRAVVIDGDVEMVAQRTSGVVVNVTFSETLEDPDAVLEQFMTLFLNLAETAKAADDGLAGLGIAYPDGERSASLSELMGQVEGALFSLRLSVNGMITQAVGVVTRLIDMVTAINDARQWVTHGLLIQLFNGLIAMRDRANEAVDEWRGRVVVVFVLEQRGTLDEVANMTGNTLGEIMRLNLSLLTTSFLPAGTAVKYYKG